MHKSIDNLIYEADMKTQTYRCKYLELLVEKYVKTQDKSLEIDLRTFKISRSTNYLNQLDKKPFGYTTSYECKSTKKTIHYCKKKVVLKKRHACRKYVGVESSFEEYNSVNSKGHLKYLSPGKARQFLSSVQNDKSSYEESELFNERELNDTHYSASSAEENESILSYEDNPYVLSDITKIASKKKQNKVFRENKVNRSLTSNDKKFSLSANNVKQHSNFELKNCESNLLQFNKNGKELKILIEDFVSTGYKKYEDYDSKIVYEKLSIRLKAVSTPKNQDERENCSSPFNVSKVKSFYDCTSSKSAPKFRFSDIGVGIGISNKSCQSFNACKVKSLPYASRECIVPPKFNFSKIGMGTLNKNSRTMHKTLPLQCASALSSPSLDKRNSLTVDSLAIKTVSNNKQELKKKHSSGQSTYNNICKAYKDYFQVNSVKIDDLSLRSISSDKENT